MPKIIKAYQPLYTSKKRYKLLTGGRGSGKTFVVMDYEARCLLQKNDRCLYTRYTMTSAEKSIIPEFKQRLEDIGISQICNTTMDTVTNLMNGSFVFFSGLKPSSNTQKANLKSLPDINRWIIEEGEDFDDFERFNKIDDSIRTTKAHNEVLWLQNPSTAEHFIYKTYFEKSYKTVKIDGFDVQICTHPDVEHIHTTFLDNIDNLDKSFLQKAYEWREKAKKGDPQAIRFYTNNYLGAWVDRPEGVVFTNWEEGEFDESLQFIFGQDFGFEDPTTLIKVAVDEKNKIIYADELVYQSHLNPDQLLAYNKNYAKGGLIVGDSNRIDTIYDLRRKGVNIMPTTKFHGSIESGIYRMLGYKLIVTPTSYNLKKELRNYVYLDKGAKVFVDKWNHCFVGTTMICTDHGLKQIKNIKVGDMVSTSKGFRKVVNVFDNGRKNVCDYTFLFSMFTVSLTGTEDHKIKTVKGWKKLSDLTLNDHIYLESNLMAKYTIYTLWNDIFQRVKKDCTELYGSFTMAKFQKATTFIIKMATIGIMTLVILTLLNLKYICQTTLFQKLKKIGNLLLIGWIMPEHLQVNGTKARKVGVGIQIMAKLVLLKERLKLIFASNATKNLSLNQNQRFVQMHVNQHLEDYHQLMTKQEFASTAELILLLISIVRQCVVQNHVLLKIDQIKKSDYKYSNVYDLEVDECHEYFANGILAHNCIDATRYAFMHLTFGR